jgi:hypothetical protein
MPTRKKTATTKTVAPKKTTARLKKSPASVTHEDIALAAYAKFEARGHHHGHDVEDWIAAEAELRASS